MTERVHGYIIDDRLGTLMGDNAFVSIGVNAADVKVLSTGVLTPLAQFKALYAVKPDRDMGNLVSVPGTETGIALGVPGSGIGDVIVPGVPVVVPNVPAALRTFGKNPDGTPHVITSDADYVAAWAAQENLRRLVDTVQQRAVLIAMSKAGLSTTATTGNVDTTNARSYGEWSADLTAVGDKYYVTFLVERSTSFDKARPNGYGQPGGVIIGQELVDELSDLSLLSVAAGSADTGSVSLSNRVAVRIDRSVPQII